MKAIVVTGAHGLVGRALVEQGCIGLSRQFLDITHYSEVDTLLDELQPLAVINAAAQANVNAAEHDKKQSFLVNGHAVAHLAKSCANRNIRFVHISTDYVLDDPTADTLSESLPTAPRSVYARSKLMGEEAALQYGAVVVRIQWVYALGGQNFFTFALQQLAQKKPLSLVTDQVGIPSYVGLLAQGLVRCAQGGATGLFHLAYQGEATAERWITAAAQHLQLPLAYQPISRLALSGAYRPARSCLAADKFAAAWNFRLPHWEVGLAHALAAGQLFNND